MIYRANKQNQSRRPAGDSSVSESAKVRPVTVGAGIALGWFLAVTHAALLNASAPPDQSLSVYVLGLQLAVRLATAAKTPEKEDADIAQFVSQIRNRGAAAGAEERRSCY